jgi:hypothetical protein
MFQLESLDERIAPAHLGVGALHAEIALHRAALLARIEAHAHARAMHDHPTAQLNRMAPAASTAAAASSTTGNAHVASAAHGAPVLSGMSIAIRGATLLTNPSNTTMIPVSTTSPTPTPSPTPSPGATQVASSLPANAGNILNAIYQEYQDFLKNPTGTFTSSFSSTVLIQGTNVGVDVHGNGSGDFNALVATLQGLGMQVTATDPVTQTVEGMVPIAQLPAVAQEAQTKSLSPIFVPVQGSAVLGYDRPPRIPGSAVDSEVGRRLA